MLQTTVVAAIKYYSFRFPCFVNSANVTTKFNECSLFVEKSFSNKNNLKAKLIAVLKYIFRVSISTFFNVFLCVTLELKYKSTCLVIWTSDKVHSFWKLTPQCKTGLKRSLLIKTNLTAPVFQTNHAKMWTRYSHCSLIKATNIWCSLVFYLLRFQLFEQLILTVCFAVSLYSQHTKRNKCFTIYFLGTFRPASNDQIKWGLPQCDWMKIKEQWGWPPMEWLNKLSHKWMLNSNSNRQCNWFALCNVLHVIISCKRCSNHKYSFISIYISINVEYKPLKNINKSHEFKNLHHLLIFKSMKASIAIVGCSCIGKLSVYSYCKINSIFIQNR